MNDYIAPDNNAGGIDYFISAFPSLRLTREKAFSICEETRTCPFDLNRLIHLDPVLFLKTQFLYKCFYPEQKAEYVSIAKIITVLHINTIRNYTKQSAKTAAEGGKKNEKAEEALLKRDFAIGYISRLLGAACGVEREKLQIYYAAGFLLHFEDYIAAAEVRAGITKHLGFSSVLNEIFKHKQSCQNYNGRYKHILYCALAADSVASRLTGASSAGQTELPGGDILDYLGVKADVFARLKPVVRSAVRSQFAFLKGER